MPVGLLYVLSSLKKCLFRSSAHLKKIFFIIFFDVDHFFKKSLLNLLQYCFCFMFWLVGCKACGILAPRPGIEPSPPALEGEVLTTGPPGKSPASHSYAGQCSISNGKYLQLSQRKSTSQGIRVRVSFHLDIFLLLSILDR